MKFGTLNEINDYNNKKAQLSLTNPRNPAKIAPIRRAYNVVADNIGLSSCVQLLLRPKSAKSREIHSKIQTYRVRGHPRSSILVSIESPYVTCY